MSPSPAPSAKEIVARQTLCRGLFDWCLGHAEACLKDQDDDAAVNWLHVAANLASAFGFGQLTSSRLENAALQIAARLGAAPEERPAANSEPRRWLHVLSIAYAVGGHTALLHRWIENDDSGDEHHLALTSMDALALPELKAAVERSGGTVTALGGIPSLRERARVLRELASREADRVVLHTHMWDVVPTVAFGVAGGPPVLLLNHADHVFWVGASIADLVVNVRQASVDLARRNRGVDRNFLFRIPLPSPRDPSIMAQDRQAVRARLGIPETAIVFVTVGAAYKYKALGDLDFLAMVRALLSTLPAAYLVAVGPSAEDDDWDAAVEALGDRLIPVGVQHDVAAYHAAADIYLEGFPFDSHTALLEAAVSGLPVVRIPACVVPPFSAHDFPLSEVPQPADVEAYLAQAISLAKSDTLRASTEAKLHEAVVGLQCGPAWRQRLRELKEAAPGRHAIYEPHPVDVDRDLADFWTAFRMRVNRRDPLKYVLKLAAEANLDTGAEVIFEEYRRIIGRKDAEARNLRAHLAALEDEAEKVSEELAEKQRLSEKLRSIQESSSWRLTSPLRAIRRMFS
ncbi:hypothetical protein [Methyloceanibacter sp. wino2]|uniref:hypothetical protein n=1 Tax=Methyloceanibacter sp. wino2 TaxID=2170729 RepID=UPI000D3E4130|nr:hypothetical protein [Methyloceanibacter sp. wino2]